MDTSVPNAKNFFWSLAARSRLHVLLVSMSTAAIARFRQDLSSVRGAIKYLAARHLI